MQKHALFAILVMAALIVNSVLVAQANDYGMGRRGMGYGMASLTSEKQQAVDEILKASEARMAPMREKMDAKRVELEALTRTQTASPETVSKLANEVADLRAQLRREMNARMEKITAETGMRMGQGYGRGYGRGGMGGHGHYGMMGGGSGSCPNMGGHGHYGMMGGGFGPCPNY